MKNPVLKGQRYGRLVVIDASRRKPPRPSGRPGDRAALCRCDCGNERLVDWSGLRLGHTASCGCYNREITAARNRAGATHGLKSHPMYRTWYNIVHRCTNPADTHYRHYGGRGVSIHPEWATDPTEFITWIEANLGPRPEGKELDRINNDGNYEPGNLRWATRSEQVRNTRKQAIIKARIPQVKALAAAGFSQEKIATILGIGQATVWRDFHS